MRTLFIMLTLFLSSCGSSYEEPYCPWPSEGDLCFPSGQVIEQDNETLAICNKNGRVEKVLLRAYNKNTKKTTYIEWDDACLEKDECFIEAFLCR